MKKIIYAAYPFLIACYPILALRNYNIIYVDLATILRTLLIAILLTVIVYTFLYIVVYRDWPKSGVATSLALIVIFSYGHLHTQSASVLGEPIRHSYLLSILIILYLIIALFVSRKPSVFEASRNFLSVAAVALVGMSLGQAAYFEYSAYQTARMISAKEADPAGDKESTERPDIYLIVLDAHTRSDILKDDFGYDNSGFINELEDLGFYVATCSQSNYASTTLSLSSLFRMEYIPASSTDSAKLPPFKETIVRKTLASRGYFFITFENRASGHFDLQEDVRLSQNQLLLGELNLVGGLNEFENVMLRTSIAKFFLDTRLIAGFNEESLVRLENYEHFQQTRFILSKLSDVPGMKGPKFVFVHIMVPHSPYIFTADGEFKNIEDSSRSGYRDNTEFIDRNILTAIQAILAESKSPPIILLMGDHGPPPGRFTTREDRMKILNAYYVNQDTMENLYDSITPVNSFRVIFNQYFGGSYPLMEDISHYAHRLKQLNEASIVENTCSSSE